MGLQYRTSAVWVKPSIGMGYFVRQQHELMLIAKRGELPMPSPEARPSSVIKSARGAHSEKPIEGYELIDGSAVSEVRLFTPTTPARLGKPEPKRWRRELGTATLTCLSHTTRQDQKRVCEETCRQEQA